MADVLVKSKEAVVIILDIGPSMCSESKHTPSLLSKAKSFVTMFLQRKIFSESKDEIALILIGSSETSNTLAATEYDHVEVVQDLRPASWELLKFVHEIKGADVPGDLIKSNGLLVAIDLLQNTVNEKKFFSRKILFLSDFDDLFYEGQVDAICEGLRSAKIGLNFIGPCSLTHKTDCSDGLGTFEDGNTDQMKAVDLIAQVLKDVNGVSYSFEEALPALIYSQKKSIQSLPWNANLDIGKNLTIPISAYIKVYESKSKPWKNAFAHKLNAKIERETTYHLNDEAQTEVSKDNMILAYRYGTTLVPFSEEDKSNMEYKSGEKGMKVLGFTKKEHVHKYYYMGDKTMYIFGQKNRELAGVILAPFIQALYETEMVAIVRYVYSARSPPKIGFLAPRIKENYECLVFVALPFMEDLRHFVFAPLDADPKNLPTDEQLSAVDELITSMDLSLAAKDIKGNIGEGLKPKYTVNPFLQRLYQCLQERVISSSDTPFPEISQSIRAVIDPSPEVLIASEPVIKKMRNIFPLNESAKKRRYEIGESIFANGKSNAEGNPHKKIKIESNSIVGATSDRVVEVGTINPVHDFRNLMDRSSSIDWFKKICKQLESAVLRFLSDEKVNLYHDKIVSCLHEYRASSIKKEEPSMFNLFMKSLKGTIISRSPTLWAKIVDEKLGLITTAECFPSTVSFQEAAEFNTNLPEESIVMSQERMDDDEQDLLAEL